MSYFYLLHGFSVTKTSYFFVISFRLSANLLRLLCQDAEARSVTRLLDGVHILLSAVLHSDSARILWNVVWCLVQLLADPADTETALQVRALGGLPMLLALLQ